MQTDRQFTLIKVPLPKGDLRGFSAITIESAVKDALHFLEIFFRLRIWVACATAFDTLNQLSENRIILTMNKSIGSELLSSHHTKIWLIHLQTSIYHWDRQLPQFLPSHLPKHKLSAFLDRTETDESVEIH
jgi:hypothetical protein